MKLYMIDKNNTFKLGRSLVKLLPFQVKKQIVEQKQKEIITSELVITMVVIQPQKLLC